MVTKKLVFDIYKQLTSVLVLYYDIRLSKYRLKYGFVWFFNKTILIEHNTAKRMSGINFVILPALKLEFHNQFVSLPPA